MRIISGEFRGRGLVTPRTLRLRPTSDKVRESIFNILREKCVEAEGLDLFAGVGTVGLEALSREAQHVTFVEKHNQSLEFLRRNIEFCRERVDVVPADIRTALKVLSKKKKSYDIIFLDPPFDQGWVVTTLGLLDTFSLLKPYFVIIVQHSKDEPLGGPYKNFDVTDVRLYGQNMITFLREREIVQ